MKHIWQNAALKKGLFALAVVMVAGASGLVYAATDSSTNATSGYGTTPPGVDQAVADLNQGFDSSSNTFRQQVRSLVAEYKAANVPGAASADQFNTAFEAANGQFDDQVADAQNDFLAAVQQAASTAESKDQFIDRFNRAKADYFNALDAAKNQFAATVSNLGHSSNVAKDRFMNGFNSSRDSYGNQLEVLKNKFADTVGNARTNASMAQ